MGSEKSVSYRNLEVWQKAINLAESIYQVTGGFPAKETFGLTSQLRRCAVSIASNIAEGQARQSRKEFQHFLHISLGSIAELETQLIIAQKISYLSEANLNENLSLSSEIARMIKGLVKHLKANI